MPTQKEMEADTQTDFERRLAEGLPVRHAHTMGGRQWQYNDEIADLAGCQRIPRHVRELYDQVHTTRAVNLTGYKKINFQLVDGQYVAES